jgi:hypothetical protein
MYHTHQQRMLRVNIETKECELPRDELPRIEEPINQIADAIGDMPGAMELTIVRHPRTSRFHVEAALALPRRTLFTGDWDPYLDIALSRSLRKLTRKAEAYTSEPDRADDERAQRIDQMGRDVVAPENPDMGTLGQAATEGDYHRFREILAAWEDWLRLRIGRWLQRYPDAEAEVGRRVKIGDLVEEVMLNAFEHFTERSNDVPLHEWLDSLIDPSLMTFCQHPVEERANISFARTLKEMPAIP